MRLVAMMPVQLHDVVGPYLASLDEKLHQRMPPAGSEPEAGGGLWPSDWTSGAAVGASAPNQVAPASGSEQGADGGWNFWPGGAAPQPPAIAPAPQNYPPLTLPQPNGSFGLDPGAGGSTFPMLELPGGSGPQQAQQPNWNWTR